MILGKKDRSSSIESNGLKVDMPKIVGGFWSNPTSGIQIKEACYGENVKFTIGTKDIPDGTILNLTLYDWDGALNPDDELKPSFNLEVQDNIAVVEFTPDEKWNEEASLEVDKTIEAYFIVKADIDNLHIEKCLPEKSDDYLKIYTKEVKITIIVEEPHSKATG